MTVSKIQSSFLSAFFTLGILIPFSLRANAMVESTLPTTFHKVAIPYFLNAASLALVTPDGVELRYRLYPGLRVDKQAKKGLIVIANGRTEFMEKYAELLYDLKESGYSVLIYDHRGQGESERLLEDPIKGFVAHSSDYVKDLKQVIDEVALPADLGPVFILANSMGGAIAAQYLIENPSTVSAFAAVSPMFAPALKGVPQDVAFELFEGLSLFEGQDYVYGQSYDPLHTTFAGNSVTSSINRFHFAVDALKRNPKLAVGGPTNRWTLEAIRMGIEIRAHASRLLTPTLIFQAGNELVVLPEAENEVQAKAKNAKLIRVEGAMHEILMERHELRDPVILQILKFFDSQPR